MTGTAKCLADRKQRPDGGLCLCDGAGKPAMGSSKSGRIAVPRRKLQSLGGRGHFPGANAARRACNGVGEDAGDLA